MAARLQRIPSRIRQIDESPEEPELIFQVFTRNLPQYDQQALQDGIGVRDYEELVARIEDFIS